jgi:hypothetical protein
VRARECHTSDRQGRGEERDRADDRDRGQLERISHFRIAQQSSVDTQ